MFHSIFHSFLPYFIDTTSPRQRAIFFLCGNLLGSGPGGSPFRVYLLKPYRGARFAAAAAEMLGSQ